MVKSFIYQNERINKTEFLVEIVTPKDDEFNHRVTFFDIDEGGKQQVSTYYLETLIEDEDSCDLILHGGVPEWTIENEAIKTIRTLWGHLVVD